MSTPLQQLAEHGQSVWIDYLSRALRQGRRPQGPGRAGRRRRDVQPDDLPGRDRRGRRLRRPDPRAERRARRSQGDLLAARQGRHPRRLRHPAPRLGRGRGQGRLGLARGRPEPRARHRGDQVRGRAPARARRPPEPLHQDPGHARGPAGDRGHDRRRHPGQRDADLLARAPPQGRRGLRRAASSASSTAAATRPAGRVRRLVLRLARGHRGRQAPRRASAATTSSRASSRSPTPSSPTRPTARSSRPRSGRRWRPRARPSSAACGRRPSTKNPDYKDTVYVEELVGPDTVNTMPRELVEAVEDHGEIRGDTLARGRRGGEPHPRRSSRPPASTTTTSSQTLEREGVEKFAKSFADLIEGLESKLKTLVAA